MGGLGLLFFVGGIVAGCRVARCLFREFVKERNLIVRMLLLSLLVCGFVIWGGVLYVVLATSCGIRIMDTYMIEARYSAEAVPVIGDIRTKVELFRIEHNYLPGVQTNGAGKALCTTSDLIGGAEISGTNGVQYMIVSEPVDDVAKEQYFCGGTELGLSDPRLGCHVWKQLGIDATELRGGGLYPHHMRHLVLHSNGDAYFWVIGCLGDGNVLRKGTGYAVAEYNDPVSKRKFVAKFKQYKPDFDGQLSLFVDDSTDIDVEDFRTRGLIYLPSWTAMTNDYNKAVGTMRKCGWQVN